MFIFLLNTCNCYMYIVYRIYVNVTYLKSFNFKFKERPNYDNAFKLKYLDMVVQESLRMHPPATR